MLTLDIQFGGMSKNSRTKSCYFYQKSWMTQQTFLTEKYCHADTGG